MLDLMYDIPTLSNIKKCIITEDVIRKKQEPILIFKEKKKSESA